MADTKITALTALTGADPANDVIPIVDVSDTTMAASGTTKKISVNNILGASGTATLASATITGDLTVDTSTLKVDSANNRVGIGTASPTAALDIFGAFGTSTAAAVLRNNSAFNNSNIVETQYFATNSNTGLDCIGKFGALNPAATGNNYGQFYWQIANAGSPTTAMTLNSTGLGVGGSPTSKLSIFAGADGDVGFFRGGSTRQLQIGTSATAGYLNADNGSAGFELRVNGTARAYFDTSGNVGIGVTPSAWVNLKTIQFGGGSSIGGGFNANWLQANAFYDGTNWKYIATAAASRLQHDDAFKFFIAPSGTAGTAITFTQAMTLTAAGELLVTKTTANATVVGVQATSTGEFSSTMASSVSAQSTLNVYSTGAAAYRFYVGMNGTINATNTTISAISDARLKENVQDIDVGLGAILALKPRKFDWKEGKGKNIKGDRGFIAQEFEQVFPNLIDEWKDAVPEGEAPYKSVRQDLIPVLVKAIQELAARVQTLETR